MRIRYRRCAAARATRLRLEAPILLEVRCPKVHFLPALPLRFQGLIACSLVYFLEWVKQK